MKIEDTLIKYIKNGGVFPSFYGYSQKALSDATTVVKQYAEKIPALQKIYEQTLEKTFDKQITGDIKGNSLNGVKVAGGNAIKKLDDIPLKITRAQEVLEKLAAKITTLKAAKVFIPLIAALTAYWHSNRPPQDKTIS